MNNMNSKHCGAFFILPIVLLLAFAYSNYFQFIHTDFSIMEFGITLIYTIGWFFLYYFAYKVKAKGVLLFYTLWWCINSACISISFYSYIHYKEISNHLQNLLSFIEIPHYPFTGFGLFTYNRTSIYLISLIISWIFTLCGIILFFLCNQQKHSKAHTALNLDKTVQ